MRVALGLCGGLVFACGGGAEGAGGDAGLDEDVVFEDGFEDFAQSGVWGRTPGIVVDSAIGLPAPSVAFTSSDSMITQDLPWQFDGRDVRITMDVRIDPMVVGASDLELRLRGDTGATPVLATFRHVGNLAVNDPVNGFPAGMSAWMVCGDEFAAPFEPVELKSDFYAVQMIVTTAGYRCRVGEVETTPADVPLDPGGLRIELDAVLGIPASAIVNIDNVRVLRAR